MARVELNLCATCPAIELGALREEGQDFFVTARDYATQHPKDALEQPIRIALRVTNLVQRLAKEPVPQDRIAFEGVSCAIAKLEGRCEEVNG